MKTIVIANNKGGVGKSTTTVHVVHALAEAGHKVVAVDLDAQANSSKTLSKYDTGITAYDLYTKPIEFKSIPDQNLYLIKATDPLNDIDRRQPSEVIKIFGDNLKNLADSFDFCIFDTPPNIALRSFSAIYLCDFILIPIQLEDYAMDGTTKMLKSIYGWKEEYKLKCEIMGILPSNVDTTSQKQKARLLEILNKHGGLFFHCKITHRPLIAEAIEEKVPVWRLKKNTKDATEEFAKLFEQMFPKLGLTFNGFKKGE